MVGGEWRLGGEGDAELLVRESGEGRGEDYLYKALSWRIDGSFNSYSSVAVWRFMRVAPPTHKCTSYVTSTIAKVSSKV